TKNEDIVTVRNEGLQNSRDLLRQRCDDALGLGNPGVLLNAVWKINESHPAGRLDRCKRHRRMHGIEERQSDGGPESAQERAPRKTTLQCNIHPFPPGSPLRIWKGLLFTISRTNVENR